jgi:hypothetical protein
LEVRTPDRPAFRQVTFITEKAACPAVVPPWTSRALLLPIMTVGTVFKPVDNSCIPYQLAHSKQYSITPEFYIISENDAKHQSNSFAVKGWENGRVIKLRTHSEQIPRNA